MDPLKKEALLGWVNALLPGPHVDILYELKDGKLLLDIIKLTDEAANVSGITTEEGALCAVKQFLEGFYHGSIDISVASSFNFECLLHANNVNEQFDVEMAKILLSLLGACVQERKKEMFVGAATTLEEKLQYKVMEMVEPFINGVSCQLPDNLNEILTKSSVSGIPPHMTGNESSTHVDAALFFKLVSQGATSGMMSSTPIGEQSFQFPNKSLLLNGIRGSPVSHSNAANMSLNEINSPLRMLTLTNSPATPLSALMQSPQFAQKALLRQKEKEILKLQQNEFHIRNDLEIDLQEKISMIAEKDSKINELEAVVREYRQMKDSLDELEFVKIERDRISKELTRAQTKINQVEDTRQHCQYLESSSKEVLHELENAKLEIRSLESLEKSHKEYRARCHQHECKLAEYENDISLKTSQLEQYKVQLQELTNVKADLQAQRDDLRQKLSEMEDSFVFRGNNSCAAIGESMGVISDKRIGELEHELSIKSTWIDPVCHKILEKELAAMVQSRDSFKTDMQLMTQNLSSLKSQLEQLTCTNASQSEKILCLEGQVEELEDKRSELSKDVVRLETQLGHTQAEVQLQIKEAEMHKIDSDTRRQTLAASIDTANIERKSLEGRLSQEKASSLKQIDTLTVKLRKQQQASVELEEGLRVQLQECQSTLQDTETRLHSCQSTLKETNILLDNERWTKDNTVKALKEELKELRTEMLEVEDILKGDINSLKESKQEIENQFEQERLAAEEKYIAMEKQLKQERLDSEEKYNSMENQFKQERLDSESKWTSDNTSLRTALQDVSLKFEQSEIEIKSLIEKWNQAISSENEKTTEITRLQGQLQISDNASAELQKRTDSLLKDLECKDQEHAELQEQLQVSKNLSSELQSRIDSLLKDLQTEKEGYAQLQDQLQAQVDSLLSDLRCEKEGHTAMIEQIQHKHHSDITALKSSLSQSEDVKTQVQLELRSHISDLESSLETKNQEYHKMEQELQGQISTLESCGECKKQEYQKKEEELQGRVSDMESHVESKTQEFKQHEQQFKEIISVREEQLSQSETLNAKNDETIINLEAQLEALNTKYQGLQHANEQLESDIQLRVEECESLTQECSELKDQLAQQKEYLNLLGDEQQVTTKIIEDTKAQNEQTIKTYQADKESLCAKVRDKNLSLEEKSREIHNLESQLETLHAECSAMRTSFSESDKKFSDDVINLIEKHRTECEKLQETIESVRSSTDRELSTSKSELANKDQDLEMKTAQIQEMESTLLAKDQDLEMKAAQFQEMKSTLLSKDQDLEMKAAQIQEMESTLLAKDQDLEVKSITIQDLQSSLEEKDLNLEVKVADIDVLQSMLEKEREENTRMTEEHQNDLVSLRSSSQYEVDVLESRISSQEEEYHSLMENYREGEECIDKLHLQITELKALALTSTKGFKGQIEDLQGHIRSLQGELTEQRALVESQSGTIQQFKESFESEKRKVIEITGQNESDHTELVDSHNKIVESLQVQLNSVKEKLEAELSEEKKEVHSLHQELLSSKQQCENNLLNHNNTVESLHQEINTLKESFATTTDSNDKMIQALKEEHLTEKANHESELSSLSAQFAESKLQLKQQHESELSSLSSQFAESKLQLKQQHELELSSLSSQFAESKLQLKQQHEDQLQKLMGDFTSTDNELKEESKKRQLVEQSFVELQQKLAIETDTREKVKEMYENEIKQMKTELVQSNESVQTMKSDASKNLEETQQYWQNQLGCLQTDYYRGTEELKQTYNDQRAEQESRFSAKFEALMQEKEMILTNQKATFQDRVNHLEARLIQKQADSEKLESRLSEEKAKMVDDLKSDHKQQFENIQKMIDAEIETSKELSSDLQKYKIRCEELEASLREQQSNYENSLTSKSDNYSAQLANIKEEYRLKIVAIEKEKTHLLEEEHLKRLAAEDKNVGHQKEVEGSLVEVTGYKQQVIALEQERDQMLADCDAKVMQLSSQVNDYEARDSHRQQRFDEEVIQCREKYHNKVAELMKNSQSRESELQREIAQIKDGYLKMEVDMKQVSEQLAQCEKQRDHLETVRLNYNKYYKEKKEELELQIKEKDIYIKRSNDNQNKADKFENDFAAYKSRVKIEMEKKKAIIAELETQVASLDTAPWKLKLQEETKKSLGLVNANRSLEVQVQHAERTIKKYKQQLEMAGDHMLGDNSEFMKVKMESDNHDTAMDFTFLDHQMETPYNLRSKSRKNSLLDDSLTMVDSDIKPVMNLANLGSDSSPESSVPLVTSDLGMSLRSQTRRESMASLNKSVLSTDSGRSVASIPRGTMNLFSGEDEPTMEFNWNRLNDKRLNELKHRNTLCLPHLKTVYPIETQEQETNDKKLRESQVGSATKHKKRKQSGSSSDEDRRRDSCMRSKQAKHHGTVYQKPGPPTPVNAHLQNKRHSKGTPKYCTRGSPHTPAGIRRSKRTPKRSDNAENEDLVKKSSKKGPLSFNIGFTPKFKKFTQKTGLFDSAVKNTNNSNKVERKPLKNKNYLQTGV